MSKNINRITEEGLGHTTEKKPHNDTSAPTPDKRAQHGSGPRPPGGTPAAAQCLGPASVSPQHGRPTTLPQTLYWSPGNRRMERTGDTAVLHQRQAMCVSKPRPLQKTLVTPRNCPCAAHLAPSTPFCVPVPHCPLSSAGGEVGP